MTRIARSALLAIALSATATLARANDFTGPYVGLNAGYGWSKGDRREGGAPALPSATMDSSSRDLPPSAARAAGRNPSLNESRIPGH